jgi:hypothetical protein
MQTMIISGLLVSNCHKKDNLKDLQKIIEQSKPKQKIELMKLSDDNPKRMKAPYIDEFSETELYELEHAFDNERDLLIRIKNGESCVRCDLTGDDPNRSNNQ